MVALAFNLLNSSWLEVSKTRGSSSKNCLNASLYSTVLLFVFTHVNNNSAETAEAHPPDLLRGTSFHSCIAQRNTSSHHTTMHPVNQLQPHPHRPHPTPPLILS